MVEHLKQTIGGRLLQPLDVAQVHLPLRPLPLDDRQYTLYSQVDVQGVIELIKDTSLNAAIMRVTVRGGRDIWKPTGTVVERKARL